MTTPTTTAWVEFHVSHDNPDEFRMTARLLAEALNTSLPEEWFSADESGWHVTHIAGLDHTRTSYQLMAASLEEQKRLTSHYMKEHEAALTQFANLEKKNNNQNTIITQMIAESKVKSVGITLQEYEQVREAVRTAIDRAGQARIEDATGALDNLFSEIDDALDLLPVMDERDLGWGDDEQLTELEAVSATISDQATELAAMLDTIRTGR